MHTARQLRYLSALLAFHLGGSLSAEFGELWGGSVKPHSFLLFCFLLGRGAELTVPHGIWGLSPLH